MTDAALVFGGVIVSLLVTFIKKKAGTSTWGTMVSVVVLSLMAGGLYMSLVHFGYWESVLKVFATAGAFYAYVIKNFGDLLNA